MSYYILITFILINSSFAACILIESSEKNLFKFQCDNEIVEERCAIKSEICEFKINKKLKVYNVKFKGEKLVDLSELEKSTGSMEECNLNKKTISCSKVDICSNDFNLKKTLEEKIVMQTKVCDEHENIMSNDTMTFGTQLVEKTDCTSRLIDKKLLNSEMVKKVNCASKHINFDQDFDCQISNLYRIINDKSQNGFVEKCVIDKMSESESVEFQKRIVNIFNEQLSASNITCEHEIFQIDNVDRFICIRVQEIRPGTLLQCTNDRARRLTGELASTLTSKNTTQQNTEIKDQPIAEYKRELPTEAPKINHQETLSKIDKLIADNGGNVTPEVAQKAGEIFNAGIYQPTKNFLKTVEQAIGSASSSTSSSSSSSKYRSSKSKSYEIGSKGARNNRVIANVDTAEATAASTTAMNTKISTSTGNVVPSLEKNSAEGASDNMGKENKQASSSFVSNNSSGPSSMGGHVGGSPVGALSNNGSARNAELQELPALSSSDKTQISLVVKALKEAESPEDIKSIVTVEENYSQVKRMIQELEQKKRQPASQQNSTEIKEFEKTLNKFGIKVYGESGPGKAVYTPATVNHVIVLKDNSIRFLNTIRSKR